jgi:1,4-alpha-glucan branching enzyme
LGLPFAGEWQEILNTDAQQFGGSGVGNLGSVKASHEGTHGQPHSARVNLPPLGAIWLKPKTN